MDKENYIKTIKGKFSFEEIHEFLEKSRDLKILMIGDTILDEYVFVQPKGRAIKDPILSVEFHSSEVYPGGILAIANHISSYVKEATLVTLLGDNHKDFVEKSLAKNIKTKYFIKKGCQTTVKRRYIDSYKNNKLFKVEFMDDKPLGEEPTSQIIKYLGGELLKYDMVLVADFGHGFINNEIRSIIQLKSKYIALNVQTNSANMGYNYVNNYKRADFVVMSQEEIRLAVAMAYDEIEHVVRRFYNMLKFREFIVTIGRSGCVYCNKGKLIKAPALSDHIVDTVGAGDAVLTVTSLMSYLGADEALIPFIANCTGAIKIGIMGNKESVSKVKLLNFIRELYEK